MSFAAFVAEFGITIVFYIVIISLIIINRKKFSFEAKIIALYRTKIGLKLMKRWGEGAERLIKVLAVVGIVVGFAGMALSVFLILQGFYNLLFVPSAPPTFAPVIPGARIPGLGIKVPLFSGLVALFISIVVHEFSHGLVAAAHRLRLKHSGFVMFGPLPGAFVEPDEKQLQSAKTKTQLAVYAAGPFSNILLTIVVILLFGFLPILAGSAGSEPSEGLVRFTRSTSVVDFSSLREKLYEPTGLRIIEVVDGSPARGAGLPNGTLVTSINGVGIMENLTRFAQELGSLDNLTPGQEVVLGSGEESWKVLTAPRPGNESVGFIGIQFEVETRKNPLMLERVGSVGFFLLERLYEVVLWIILLSSGLGLANLLPLGPVDGGRMLLSALERYLPKERARLFWSKISVAVLVAVLLLVFVPIFKSILPL